MTDKPTYEELELRVRKLEEETNRRKRAEKELMDSEERFRYLTESSPLGVFQTDKDGSVLYLNNKWLAITGMSMQDALGFGWAQALHHEDKPRTLAEWARCLEEKRGYDGEFRFVRPFGGIRWVHTRTSPVFSPDGDIISHVGVNEDITERKQAEEALQKIHVELEQRVEERTSELDDQKNRLRFLSSRLIKAQEQERRRFSRGLHDEMGQALAILKIRLRSIQREFPEGQSSLKEEFDDTAQYIDQIIENVRRLSRDLSPAILEDLGLSSALEWLIENFGKQHSIRTSVEMINIDHLFSQETQTNLYRIFQEALTNIVKHARAGHVSFAVKKEEKGSVFFLIKDNGKGFDVNEAVAGNIAERGMGLTAMNERAHMMGAILDIQSRPGEGTRITLEISA